ncbi:MAG: periplasmic heavy metal sensor [Verrucomicrobiales bacterium]|nr:periplasmic heavy metal sensor [Verrucomicrobiales bacterium]
MKRGLWILGAALAAGIAGYALMRLQSTDHAMAAPRSASLLPELEWLRHEFDLTEAQFAETSALHLAYRPTCEALCSRVMTSHERIRQLVEAGPPITPELELALKDHAALHVECQTAMINHLYETAECLSPEQARRYLDTMLPHVIEMEMEPAGH